MATEQLGLAACPFCQSARSASTFICGVWAESELPPIAEQRTPACQEIARLREDVQILVQAYDELNEAPGSQDSSDMRRFKEDIDRAMGDLLVGPTRRGPMPATVGGVALPFQPSQRIVFKRGSAPGAKHA